MIHRQVHTCCKETTPRYNIIKLSAEAQRYIANLKSSQRIESKNGINYRRLLTSNNGGQRIIKLYLYSVERLENKPVKQRVNVQ